MQGFIIPSVPFAERRIIEMNKEQPRYLSSPAPLDDGGRTYNIIYIAAAVIIGGIGFFNGGLGAAGGGVFLGLALGYIVKSFLVKGN